MMTLSINQLVAYFRNLDRMVLIAAVLSLVAIVYAGNQGLHWWSDTGQEQELAAQARQLQTAINTASHEKTGSSTTLDEQQASFDAQTARFSFKTDDEVIGMVDQTSLDARVRLASVSASDRGTTIEGLLQYRVLGVDIRVEGQVTRIYDFIDRLSKAAPGMSVTTTQMGGFGLSPYAVLQLDLLIDPTPAPAGKGKS